MPLFASECAHIQTRSTWPLHAFKTRMRTVQHSATLPRTPTAGSNALSQVLLAGNKLTLAGTAGAAGLLNPQRCETHSRKSSPVWILATALQARRRWVPRSPRLDRRAA